VKLDTDCTTVLTDAYTHYVDGDLEIKTNKTDAPLELYTKTDGCTVPAMQNTAAQTVFSAAGNALTATPTTVQESDFSWTWTAENNKF